MKFFKMGMLIAVIALVLWPNQVFAKYDRKYIVLTVNGRQYTEQDKIKVRPGQTLTFKAVFMGGIRENCMNPHTSKYVKVLSNNENGCVSYNELNRYRMEYRLISENIKVKGAGGVEVLSVNGNQAAIKIPNNVKRASISVSSTVKWQFTSTNTRTQKVSIKRVNKQSALDHFRFQLGGPASPDKPESGQWFSSDNITAEGTEHNGLQGKLDNLQNYMSNISRNMVNRKFTTVNKQLSSLILMLADLESYIKNLKTKNSKFRCSITFTGVPSDKVMKKIKELEISKEKLKELAMIAQGNHNKINNMLSGAQDVFSANILKSVFKNYLNWSGSIPTDEVAGLASYSTNTGIADLPRNFIAWYEDAKSDSSILRNQARKIKALSELRDFYLAKQGKAVSDRKKINKELTEYQPKVTKNVDRQLKTLFSSLGWARWQPAK